MLRTMTITLVVGAASCGPAAAPTAAPAADGLPVTCEQAAGAFMHWMQRHDRELGEADPGTGWFQSVTKLIARRCELDHWSATARGCDGMICFVLELPPWQQAGVRAVAGFAFTPGFQHEIASSPGEAPVQEPREFPRSAAAIARMASCERPKCALPDAACDAAVNRMLEDVVRSPDHPDDQARIARTPSFRPSLHQLMYDQCTSGMALSGHDIGAWSAGARACFAAHGVTKECTDQLTEPQRDSGEFVIAPWFDALRAQE